MPLIRSESLEIVDYVVIYSGEAKGRDVNSVTVCSAPADSRGKQPVLRNRTDPVMGMTNDRILSECSRSIVKALERLDEGGRGNEKETAAYFHKCSHLIHGALKTYDSCRFFDWSLDALRQPCLPGQDMLSDNGRNLSSVLYAICQRAASKKGLLSWIQELTPMDAVDFEFPVDATGRILATLVERGKQKTTLASASDGTLRFLAFLAAFLGPNPSSFYFFEELENGIHPSRLGLLLDLIETQVTEKGIQVVATTHSPELLARLSKPTLEHASLVYRSAEGPDAGSFAFSICRKPGAFSSTRRPRQCFRQVGLKRRPISVSRKVMDQLGRLPLQAGSGASEMNVLVIAEDDRNDRYILLPIIRGMFRALKRPKVRVEPIARRLGLLDSVGQGRKILGEEAVRNSARVRQNCPELSDLEKLRRERDAAAASRADPEPILAPILPFTIPNQDFAVTVPRASVA